jgi:hypothetical protein
MFKESAGLMRGFRIVRDPDGILYNPFDYMGTQMGYLLTYGEGIPCVHDGQQWVQVIDAESASNFDDDLQTLIVEQATKISAAIANPVYAELAAQMGMYAGVAATPADPSASATVFGG